MDRNLPKGAGRKLRPVALRKESVDRNWFMMYLLALKFVALRKESVDRNSELWASVKLAITSLSARRAWIEIPRLRRGIARLFKSLSARRAWIEIFLSVLALGIPTVALRKESVDRNIC